MNKLDLATKITKLNITIKDCKEQAEQLQQELDNYKEKPEYHDGTIGYVSNHFVMDTGIRILVYLINTGDKSRPYSGRLTYNNEHIGCEYQNFEPLTEAILPMAVEYDGNEYIGNPDNDVRIEYKDGSFGGGKANSFSWSNSLGGATIQRYWVIKKA